MGFFGHGSGRSRASRPRPSPSLTDRYNAALAANDRAKYFFALLQTARRRADAPSRPAPDLRAERVASGVADAACDEVIAATERRDDGTYAIPGADRIVHALLDDVNTMLAPFRDAEGGEALRGRFASLAAPLAHFQGNVIAGDAIDRMTSGDRDDADSVHLLVMDVHKALNRVAG